MTLHFDHDAPYWREAAPLDDHADEPLPRKVDVAIIGGGFTGLSCALEAARLGRDVVVLEARTPGFGASTRNGGMIGWGHRASLKALTKRYGDDAAQEILLEGPRSLAFTLDLIDREGIDCKLQRTGRFLAAASPVHFARLREEAEQIFQPLGVACRVVEAADQGDEIATDVYCGGVLFEDHGGLHPGLFHKGLLAGARRHGAIVAGNAAVTGLDQGEAGWRVTTKRGVVEAKDVVFAANGYGGEFSEGLKEFTDRLLPLPSFIIATEKLGANRVRDLMPGGRMYVDTRSAHSYFRASPDGERVLWGGRASLLSLDEKTATRRLRQHMASIFPSLAETEVEMSWTGRIAYSRDGIAHMGKRNGIWFAGGYCGSGVAMAPYFGWRIAQQIFGGLAIDAAIDRTAFDKFPHHSSMPLFMRGVELWHRFKDRRDGVLAPIDYR